MTAMVDMAADVTIIVVNYNTAQLLSPCLDAISASTGSLRFQTIVVENGSRDGSAALLKSGQADCDVIFNELNVGFGRANNLAVARATGRYILLLNTDAFVAPESIATSVAYMDAHPRSSVLGVRLVGRDGILQPSCRYFPTPWNEFITRCGLARLFPRVKLVDDLTWPHDVARSCDWVPGCFYMVRASVIRSVGLFDPRYFLYYEEVDHCRAVKATGGEITFFPGTTVVHIGGESAKTDGVLSSTGRQISALQVESGLLYFRKHHGLVGVVCQAFLATIGDFYLALKSLVRARPEHGSTWQLSAETWYLLLKTSFGTRPTR